jgi:O-antigen ligase
MTETTTGTLPSRNDAARAPVGWRWAPAWVLAFVALWPAPGYAEGVMVLGAVAAIVRLLLARFRGGTRLLSAPAWALTSVLFCAYWTPELLSSFDAIDRAHAFHESLVDLRYLPFLWLVAAAVADVRGRRTTFGGLAVIAGIWTIDALLQAITGTSPLFWSIDAIKQAISGHAMCAASDVAGVDRLSGVLGPCNLKLGLVLASLSPFALHVAGKRFGAIGWSVASAVLGHVILLAGARGFRYAFPACDPEPGVTAAWGAGPALHAHQIVLEILAETGGIGLLLWLAGAALAWRAWRFAPAMARDEARPAMLALAATVFPFNTHLAFYSTFWGSVALLLAALYAGALLGRDRGPEFTDTDRASPADAA